MKRTAIIIVMTLSVALISCKKDDSPDSMPSGSNINSVPGNWKVSYYFDNNKDETHNYANYTFEFTSGGSLTAITNSQYFQGTWQNTVDDNLPRLVISISGNSELQELSDDWVITKLTTNEIWLQDDKSTPLEELRFSKI